MRAATFNENEGYWEKKLPRQDFYSIQEASEILGMGTTQIYSCINRGSMGGFMVDGKKRISHEDLMAYIEKRYAMEDPSPSADPVIQRIVPKPRPVKEVPEATVVRSISRPVVESGIGSMVPEIPTGGLDLDAMELDEGE